WSSSLGLSEPEMGVGVTSVCQASFPVPRVTERAEGFFACKLPTRRKVRTACRPLLTRDNRPRRHRLYRDLALPSGRGFSVPPRKSPDAVFLCRLCPSR